MTQLKGLKITCMKFCIKLLEHWRQGVKVQITVGLRHGGVGKDEKKIKNWRITHPSCHK